MRTFELLLWVVASASVALQIMRPSARSLMTTLAAALVPLAVLDLAFEGWRVHMVPTYALAGGSIALSLLRVRSRHASARSPLRRTLIGLPLAVLLALAGALPSVLPVYSYDEPSGSYAIGTMEYELNDHARGRELAVQVWYPAMEGARGRVAGITERPDLVADAYASFTGLPAPLFDNLRLVSTHARWNVALNADRDTYPVVVLSHGPGVGNRSQSVYQLEALASHGFVAVAIDHTGYASTTIFPDGRAVPFDPRVGWPTFVDTKSTAMLKTWVADVSFVIDRLEALNGGDPGGLLTNRLDMSRLGYLGTSFGGSVVVQALVQDARIRAGVAEDGKPYFLDEALSELRRPMLYMQSAAPYIQATDAQLSRWGLTQARFREAEQDHYARQMMLFSSAQGPIYNVYIRGTNHITFSDFYLTVRVPDLQLMDVRRAHRIINAYTIAFFDRYLNGSFETLVNGQTPSPYSEVTVASRNVPPGPEPGQLTLVN